MTLKQLVLGIGTTAFAAVTAVGVYAATQNTDRDPNPFRPFLAQQVQQGSQGQGGPGPGFGPGRGRFGGPGRGGPDGPGGGPRLQGPLGFGGPMDLPLGRLNLTDAQKDQVKAIAESYQEEIKMTGDRARAAHDALEAAVTADPFDEATIRARSAEASVVESDRAVLRARIRAEVFRVLTPEQRTQAGELRRSGGPGRSGGTGRSGGPGR